MTATMDVRSEVRHLRDVVARQDEEIALLRQDLVNYRLMAEQAVGHLRDIRTWFDEYTASLQDTVEGSRGGIRQRVQRAEELLAAMPVVYQPGAAHGGAR